MNAKTPQMLLYLEHVEAVLPILTLEDRGALFTALYEHAATGAAPDLTDRPAAQAAYAIMSAALDRNAARYTEICEKRAESGKRGGIKSGERRRKTKQTKQMKQMLDTPSSLKSQAPEAAPLEANEANEAIHNHNPNHNHKPNQNPNQNPNYFTRPTLEDIQQFASQNHYTTPPERFFDYYEARGWKWGETQITDWKAVFRNWERKTPKKPEPVLNPFLADMDFIDIPEDNSHE